MAAALLTTAALDPARVNACNDPREVLSMDHHLVRADFVGEIYVRRDDSVRSEAVVADIVETWFSRWPPSDTLEFRTTGEMRPFVRGERYVVLLSGGRWHHAPLTYGVNSIFHVLQDDTVQCYAGVPLFGVMSDGFLCAPRETVVGEPVSVDLMHDQFSRAVERARERLPHIHADRVANVRAIEMEPTAHGEETEWPR